MLSIYYYHRIRTEKFVNVDVPQYLIAAKSYALAAASSSS